MVVRPNYVLVYRVMDDCIEIIRILHARQQWP
ncbi:type II toxin-antitoxin system RelE/ParE family toxin [Pseudomonas sp.]